VRALESASAIRSSAVREAFLEVPREIFIPEVAKRLGVDAVYRDEAYPIKTDPRGDAVSSCRAPKLRLLRCDRLVLVDQPAQDVTPADRRLN
jgi:protein-L-isoaspartate O-methyltransferase